MYLIAPFKLYCIHVQLGVAQSGAITLGRNGDYSSSYSSGRVLVNHNGRWGTVCRRDTFSTTEADVMCHQLTYSGASGWSYEEEDRSVSE